MREIPNLMAFYQNLLIKPSTQSAKTSNTCSITLNVEDGRLVKIGLNVQGSALATASASLLFSELKELSLPEAQKIHERILKFFLKEKRLNYRVIFASLIQLCVFLRDMIVPFLHGMHWVRHFLFNKNDDRTHPIPARSILIPTG